MSNTEPPIISCVIFSLASTFILVFKFIHNGIRATFPLDSNYFSVPFFFPKKKNVVLSSTSSLLSTGSSHRYFCSTGSITVECAIV